MKPKCEESLSNFAFNCNLRHYNLACAGLLISYVLKYVDAIAKVGWVGGQRCSLNHC